MIKSKKRELFEQQYIKWIMFAKMEPTYTFYWYLIFATCNHLKPSRFHYCLWIWILFCFMKEKLDSEYVHRFSNPIVSNFFFTRSITIWAHMVYNVSVFLLYKNIVLMKIIHQVMAGYVIFCRWSYICNKVDGSSPNFDLTLILKRNTLFRKR